MVGTGEGPLHIFNWGEWGNLSDRFPLSAMSVDALAAVNEDIILAGASDGKIRLLPVDHSMNS